MNFNRRALRLIRGGLLILCGAFFGLIIYELVRPYRLPPGAPPPDQPEPTIDAAQEATGPGIPHLAAFSEIIERPLFTENRKPAAPPAPVAKRPDPRPETLEQVRLSAIVISDGQGLALVYTDQDRKLQTLRPGEEYKGWILKDVRPDSIFLKKGQSVRHIPLVVAPSRRVEPEAQQETPEG